MPRFGRERPLILIVILLVAFSSSAIAAEVTFTALHGEIYPHPGYLLWMVGCQGCAPEGYSNGTGYPWSSRYSVVDSCNFNVAGGVHKIVASADWGTQAFGNVGVDGFLSADVYDSDLSCSDVSVSGTIRLQVTGTWPYPPFPPSLILGVTYSGEDFFSVDGRLTDPKYGGYEDFFVGDVYTAGHTFTRNIQLGPSGIKDVRITLYSGHNARVRFGLCVGGCIQFGWVDASSPFLSGAGTVNGSQLYDIHASGSLVLQSPGVEPLSSTSSGSQWSSGSWTGGPEGDLSLIADSTFILPGVPAYSLIGKVGSSGAPFPIGACATFTAPASGQLYLGMNDRLDSFGDNSGMIPVDYAPLSNPACSSCRGAATRLKRVPSQFANIQTAIDSACDGDTILIASGTYSGAANRDLHLNGKNLTMRSESGATSTVIDCGNQTGWLTVDGELWNVLIDGLTIRAGQRLIPGGGVNPGGGVLVQGRSFCTIRNCAFTNNGGSVGGGVFCTDSSAAIIENTTFTGNSTGSGGAVAVFPGSGVVLNNCVFVSNSAYQGGGVYLNGGSVAATGCTFRSNSTFGGAGGVVMATAGGKGTLTRCVLKSNTAVGNGGALDLEGGSFVIDSCKFSGNTAATGGAIACVACSVTVAHSSLHRNSGSTRAGGLSCTAVATGIVSYSIIANSPIGEAVYRDGGSTATLSCCDLFGNTGGDWVGSIAAQMGSSGNFSSDPLFCSPSTDSLTLCADSPCLPSHNSCAAQIGALPQACAGCGPPFISVITMPLGDSGAGRGVAWGDFDGDGDPDLYLAKNLQPDKLIRNEGGITFSDVSGGALALNAACYAATWADFDNDGDLDLYVTISGAANKLFENLGGGVFSDVSSTPVADAGSGRGCAWADYDRDGKLDLFLCNFGGLNKLFRGVGSTGGGPWTFEDQTGALASVGTNMSAAWADYDNDGDPDLYIVKSGQSSRLFRNDGPLGFTDATGGGPLGSTGPGRGVAWGDYDNDGDLDVYVAYFGQANRLYKNTPGGFVQASIPAIQDAGNSTGVCWLDYDNDGDLDLFVVNQGSRDKLFRNDGGDVFTEVYLGLGENDGNGDGVAWADVDGDGDLDLYIAMEGSPNRLLLNQTANGNHWLEVKLVGSMSNRFGVGARIRAVTGSLSQIREIECGSGYLSENELMAHFGLGASAIVDTLEVRWPSGYVQRLMSVGANEVIQVVEPYLVGVYSDALPERFALYPSAPNPARESATFRFDLTAGSAPVKLQVFDVTGRLLRTLVSGVQVAGRHVVTWDARDESGNRVPTGIYLYRLQTPGFDTTRRVIVLK